VPSISSIALAVVGSSSINNTRIATSPVGETVSTPASAGPDSLTKEHLKAKG
jgi:hypothetical protein